MSKPKLLEQIKAIKTTMKSMGSDVNPDLPFGDTTYAELKRLAYGAAVDTSGYFGAPWMSFDNDLLGRLETDAEMIARFVPGWKLSGLPQYKTLIGSKHAWCIMRTNLHLEKAGIKGTKSAGARSLSKWGRKSPFWFGAQLDIMHKGGGRHAAEFLYWIDEKKKICATRDGNRSNRFAIFQTDLSGKGDTLPAGPRWPTDHPDGQLVSMKDVLAKYPFFKVGGTGTGTR